MGIEKSEVEKIEAGSPVTAKLSTGGTVDGFWGGLEKDELHMKSAETKQETDITLGAEIVDEIEVKA